MVESLGGLAKQIKREQERLDRVAGAKEVCDVCGVKIRHPVPVGVFKKVLCEVCGGEKHRLMGGSPCGGSSMWLDDEDAFGGWSNVVRAYEDFAVVG